MTHPAPRPLATGRLATVAFWIEVALWLRVAAACAVEWVARGRSTRCLFPDTDVYWELGRAIRAGGPYEISQWGVPHFTVRTPGYPLFLAICQALFGEHILPVRLVQAALGAGCVWVVYRLVRRVLPRTSIPGDRPIPLVAAALVAVEPYTVLSSALVLSEALFVPFLVLSLWGLAALWPAAEIRGTRPGSARTRSFAAVAVLTGLTTGAAVLVKPSWALAPPLGLGAWLIASGRGERKAAVLGGILVALGAAAAMAPWWVRNARVYGRFVPTALWAGASLYDGLNPAATGASDMRFLDAPELQPLDEEAQDALLWKRSAAFARAHPGSVLRLAAKKAARFWSPWPNTENLRWPAVLGGALISVPIFVLMIIGAWECRRDVRTLVLLAGPLCYFAALHMVFVSSVRYRIPGAVPAMGLAAVGARVLADRFSRVRFLRVSQKPLRG